uniref:Uncharacterized protein n=1 Tax=Aegilops tauschii subsp. strangulata TaxID=200361 RepID=A0A453I650_AEGTS
MVAPATLSLRPCATLAPSRAALPRAHAHAGFAPASRPALSVSCPPTRFESLRRAATAVSDRQGSAEPSEKVSIGARFPCLAFRGTGQVEFPAQF